MNPLIKIQSCLVVMSAPVASHFNLLRHIVSHSKRKKIDSNADDDTDLTIAEQYGKYVYL